MSLFVQSECDSDWVWHKQRRFKGVDNLGGNSSWPCLVVGPLHWNKITIGHSAGVDPGGFCASESFPLFILGPPILYLHLCQSNFRV